MNFFFFTDAVPFKVHSNSKRSTAERNLYGPGGPVMTDVHEESISTQLQGLVIIQKINVSFIQSSVVEEVITFAALDNVQVSGTIINSSLFPNCSVLTGFKLCLFVGCEFRWNHITLPFGKDYQSFNAYSLHATDDSIEWPKKGTHHERNSCFAL